MQKITVTTKPISTASSSEIAEKLKQIEDILAVQAPLIPLMKDYFADHTCSEFLFNQSGLSKLIKEYTALREKFFQKYAFLPQEAMRTIAISDKVVKVSFDNKSLSRDALRLSEANFDNLLETLNYICSPYDVHKDPLKVLNDEQRHRLNVLKEEIFVLEPLQSFNFNHAILQSVDYLKAIQVPSSVKPQWRSFMMMSSMFSSMQFQINDLKKELTQTNQRLTNLENTINSNFKQINAAFSFHQTKISSVIQRLNKNTSELDELFNRERDMPGFYYTRELVGYTSVGYGSYYETDYEKIWSHYYSAPMYKDVRHDCIIEANPTKPLQDNSFKINFEQIKSDIKIANKVENEVLKHRIFVAKKPNSNTYRLVHDNIGTLSHAANAILAGVIELDLKS